MKKVLIAAPVHRILTDWLTANGYEYITNTSITQAEAMMVVADCTGIVTSTRLLINKELLDAAPNLKWVGRMGSGMEIIDTIYAKAKGVTCFSSPEGNRNAVAEHALGSLLSLNKRIYKSFNEVKEGQWLRDENRGVELDGKTIGIIGFGNTGQAFAKKLLGFDVKILTYDKYVGDLKMSNTISCSNIDDIYKEADVVSFHVPLNNDTKHYFNAAFIEKMEKPFVLLNTSRGEVVDTAALWQGLQSKKVSGACIDVLEEEPLEKMGAETLRRVKEMAKMYNVIITPHIAGYSVEALYKMSKIVLSKIAICM
ncbi:MAG: NAD(P)-dependent oxidoreductase [Flavipsychrobacter sp.]